MQITTLRNMSEAYDLWKRSGVWFDLLNSPRELGWKAFFENSPENFLALYDQGHLIAVCVLLDDGRKLTIQRMAVDKEHRRNGVARQLIAEVEQEAVKRGLNVVCALIGEENEASRSMAKSAGYEEKPTAKYFTKTICG